MFLKNFPIELLVITKLLIIISFTFTADCIGWLPRSVSRQGCYWGADCWSVLQRVAAYTLSCHHSRQRHRIGGWIIPHAVSGTPPWRPILRYHVLRDIPNHPHHPRQSTSYDADFHSQPFYSLTCNSLAGEHCAAVLCDRRHPPPLCHWSPRPVLAVPAVVPHGGHDPGIGGGLHAGIGDDEDVGGGRRQRK